MANIRLLLLLLLCAGAAAAETGKPFISLYPSMETGGHFQNWAFAQDDRGVMYIGNGYGVQEFDGSTWRMILNSNRSFAKSFAKDSSGRIYVGSAAELGYLAADAKGAMQYVSLLEHIPAADRDFNYIWYTHATPKGIYFQARERLFRFQPMPTASGEKESWQLKIWRPDSTSGFFSTSFYEDGTLFLHKRGAGLMKMAGDSLVLLPGSRRLANDRIFVMLPFPGRPGTYLLGTNFRGLFLYDGHTLQPFHTDADAFLLQGGMSDGDMLPDGAFAVSTMSNGFLIIDALGRIRLHLTRASGLLSNTLYAAFLDRQKNIWLAMDSGIGVLESGSSLAQFSFASGSAPTFFCRHQGLFYAAANDGLFYLDQQDSQLKTVSGVPRSQANEFLAADDNLYMSTLEGVHRIVGTEARLALRSDIVIPLVISLHRSRVDSNRFIAGSMNGLLTLRYDAHHPDQLRLESIVPGFHEYIRQIIEPQPGVFWLGTFDAGALRLHFVDDDVTRPVIERFSPAQGLPGGTVSIFQLAGRLVFGTGEGLFQFDESQQRFKPDPFFKDLSLGINPSECTAAEDAAGNIWINAGKETALYRKNADGSYTLASGQFSRFNDELINTIYPEKDNSVWFGASSGAVRFTPGAEKSPPVPIAALIRAVKFADDSTLYNGGFGQAFSSPGDYIIPFRLNAITFEFSALSYIKPKANEFQIKLDGFDRNWSAWSRDNKHNYTNLPHGRYAFRVKARNIYGQESSEASFAFTIQPPWYDTWWAYLGYLLLAAGLILGLVRVRTRKLQERSKALEQVVRDRTAEIQEQKNSIEQQKNNVEQLSRIGRDITATLSIESIIHTVYENVNSLMDASVFGIGLYNPEKECLDFPGTIENNKVLSAYSLALSDENRLAVWCFKNQKDVIINDYARDYRAYIHQLQPPVAGENPDSILYLPLVNKDKTIGVITAQSFTKQAYTDYHLHMLQNLATYSAIALDNADAYRRLNALLEDLKSTQEKLITQSKLAALGALTAGIAHEIKNPLNFVNNFAVLIGDLVVELREILASSTDRLEPGDATIVEEILSTLQQNSAKIIAHGKRADGIVRSMLQHSRGKSDERQLTDLNAMLAEDINLAYHGMRAQDSSFNVKLETDFDPSVGKLEIVPQDVSRVFLNIISNGCYEVHRKKMEQNGDFAPTLSVTTRNLGKEVQVRIRDNGNGIPPGVREKLFTPFFTTKPTGKGTGLGLSISYEIIVQQHRGQLSFETQEGEFAEFIIRLPK